MTLLNDVANELFGMFLADARLTGSILALVIAAALLLDFGADPLLGGGVLLVGCLAILVEASAREARVRRRLLDR